MKNHPKNFCQYFFQVFSNFEDNSSITMSRCCFKHITWSWSNLLNTEIYQYIRSSLPTETDASLRVHCLPLKPFAHLQETYVHRMRKEKLGTLKGQLIFIDQQWKYYSKEIWHKKLVRNSYKPKLTNIRKTLTLKHQNQGCSVKWHTVARYLKV